MSLQNLLGKSLEAVEPGRTQVERLLAAAARNLADARLVGPSAENRFDAAYKAAMQAAKVALYVNGYRPLTSKTGHHQTMLQTLEMTVGLEWRQIRVLDALRKQRNVADYEGDLVSEVAVTECIEQATALLAHVRTWIQKNKPELLRPEELPH